MSADLAVDELVKSLKAAPGVASIHYADDQYTESLPRIVLEVPSAIESRVGGASTRTQGQAQLIARIEDKAGNLATNVKTQIAIIMNVFAVGTTHGDVLVTVAPTPRARYTANGVYHVPVLITGQYQY